MSRNPADKDLSALRDYLKSTSIDPLKDPSKWWQLPVGLFYVCFPFAQKIERVENRIDKCVNFLYKTGDIRVEDFLFQIFQIFKLDDARTEAEDKMLTQNFVRMFSEMLIQNPNLIKAVTAKGDNLFHMAARYNIPELVPVLAVAYHTSGIKNNMAYEVNNQGESPLQIARRLGHKDFNYNQYDAWLKNQAQSPTKTGGYRLNPIFEEEVLEPELDSQQQGSGEQRSRRPITPPGDPEHVSVIHFEKEEEESQDHSH